MERTAGTDGNATNRMIHAVFCSGNFGMIFCIYCAAGNCNVRFTGRCIPANAAADGRTGTIAVRNHFAAGNCHLAVAVAACADGGTVVTKGSYNLDLAAGNVKVLNKRTSVGSADTGIPVVIVRLGSHKGVYFTCLQLFGDIKRSTVYRTITVDIRYFQGRFHIRRSICVATIIVGNITQGIFTLQIKGYILYRCILRRNINISARRRCRSTVSGILIMIGRRCTHIHTAECYFKGCIRMVAGEFNDVLC